MRLNTSLFLFGITVQFLSQVELPHFKPFAVALSGLAVVVLTMVDKSKLPGMSSRERKTPPSMPAQGGT